MSNVYLNIRRLYFRMRMTGA